MLYKLLEKKQSARRSVIYELVGHHHLLPVLSHMISLRLAPMESDQAGIASVRKVGSRSADLLSGSRHDESAPSNFLSSRMVGLLVGKM